MRVDGLLGRLAGGLLFGFGEQVVAARRPSRPAAPRPARPAARRPAPARRREGVQAPLPGRALLPVGRHPDLPALRHPLGHLEVLVGVPAVGLLGRPDLVLAQRRAVRLGGALAVGRPPGDVAAQPDEASAARSPPPRPGRRPRSPPGRWRPPRPGCASRRPGSAPGHVLGEGDGGRPVDGDPIVVVQHRQLAQPQVPGQRRRLGRHPLHHVPVAAEHPGPVVDHLLPGPVVAGRQQPLGDREPDPVADPLPQRPGGHLHPRRVPVLGMAGGERAPLALLLEVADPERVAGEVQHRVLQHRGVPVGQDEPVPVEPLRVGRVELEEPGPEHVGGRGQRHGRARMAAAGLLDRVHRQGPDGVDRQPVKVGGRHGRGGLGGHGSSSLLACPVAAWVRPSGAASTLQAFRSSTASAVVANAGSSRR